MRALENRPCDASHRHAHLNYPFPRYSPKNASGIHDEPIGVEPPSPRPCPPRQQYKGKCENPMLLRKMFFCGGGCLGRAPRLLQHTQGERLHVWGEGLRPALLRRRPSEVPLHLRQLQGGLRLGYRMYTYIAQHTGQA